MPGEMPLVEGLLDLASFEPSNDRIGLVLGGKLYSAKLPPITPQASRQEVDAIVDLFTEFVAQSIHLHVARAAEYPQPEPTTTPAKENS